MTTCSHFIHTRNIFPLPSHPAAGRLHLDPLWGVAGAETSEREIYHRTPWGRSSRSPSLPQVSRLYDLPPPPCLNSLTPDAHRTEELLPRQHRCARMTAFQRRWSCANIPMLSSFTRFSSHQARFLPILHAKAPPINSDNLSMVKEPVEQRSG